MVRGGTRMDINYFIPNAIHEVVKYANAHLDVTDGFEVTERDVYVVWFSKTLQNAKALISTNLPDGMYYEVTYNGNKDEMYFDAYKKFENIRIDVSEEV